MSSVLSTIAGQKNLVQTTSNVSSEKVTHNGRVYQKDGGSAECCCVAFILFILAAGGAAMVGCGVSMHIVPLWATGTALLAVKIILSCVIGGCLIAKAAGSQS